MYPPLLRRIEKYMRRARLRPSAFGKLVARDPLLVFQLRRGRKLRPSTQAKVTAFLDRAERELGEKSCRRR